MFTLLDTDVDRERKLESVKLRSNNLNEKVPSYYKIQENTEKQVICTLDSAIGINESK